MFIDDKDPDSYYVAMGSINGDPELPLAHHIHVHSKAPWHEITDVAPQNMIFANYSSEKKNMMTHVDRQTKAPIHT